MKNGLFTVGTLVAGLAVPFAASAEETTVVCDDGQSTLTIDASRWGGNVAVFETEIPDTPFPGSIEGSVDKTTGIKEFNIYVQGPQEGVQVENVPSRFAMDIADEATAVVVTVQPYFPEDDPNPVETRQITCPVPGR